MQTFTVEITDTAALQTLQEMEANHLIRIVDKRESDYPDSPSLPGAPMELDAFKKWIEHAESTETISIEETKLRWAQRRKQLQQAAN